MPLNTGSRRGPSRPTAGVLAVPERTGRAVLRCVLGGGGRRSVASFGAPCNAPDRRFGVRWHPSPLPVPAVSGERYVRRESPSGILAARGNCIRPC